MAAVALLSPAVLSALAGFARWRALAGPHFAAPPQVEHVYSVYAHGTAERGATDGPALGTRPSASGPSPSGA